ncbi:hypothetical protein OROMI_004756 [Orobanche minor]
MEARDYAAYLVPSATFLSRKVELGLKAAGGKDRQWRPIFGAGSIAISVYNGNVTGFEREAAAVVGKIDLRWKKMGKKM